MITYFNEDFIAGKASASDEAHYSPEVLVGQVQALLPEVMARLHISDTPENRAYVSSVMIGAMA